MKSLISIVDSVYELNYFNTSFTDKNGLYGPIQPIPGKPCKIQTLAGYVRNSLLTDFYFHIFDSVVVPVSGISAPTIIIPKLVDYQEFSLSFSYVITNNLYVAPSSTELIFTNIASATFMISAVLTV